MNLPKQFRGVHAPAELFELVSTGQISGELAWLALVIDSYVNARGEGCFASNETLGNDTHKSPRQIQLMVRMLRGYRKVKGKWERTAPKLVKVAGWKKMPNGALLRILETKWSRLDIDSEWNEEKEPHDKNNAPPPKWGVKSNVTPNVKSNVQDIRSRVDRGRKLDVRLAADGGRDGYSTAKKLIAGLGEKKKIMRKPNLSKSAAEFDQLFKEVKQRDGTTFTEARTKVVRTMNRYLNGIDKHSHWPEAWSAAGFREKFIQIEAAIKRAEKNGEVEPTAPKAKVIHEGNGHTRYVLSLEDN